MSTLSDLIRYAERAGWEYSPPGPRRPDHRFFRPRKLQHAEGFLVKLDARGGIRKAIYFPSVSAGRAQHAPAQNKKQWIRTKMEAPPL